MSSDHEMHWVRTLNGLAARGAAEWIIEAELGSEILIPGQLTYEDHAIVLGPTTFGPDASGLYKYLLRLRCATPGAPIAFDTIEKTSTRAGYLLPGGPVTELVALFSLQLQARLFLLSTTERALAPRHLPQKTEHVVLRAEGNIPHRDAFLFAPRDERNIHTALPPILDTIRRIPAKHHLGLAVAAEHYARAVRTVGLDEELVFVRLVSAIERLMPKQAADSLSEKLLAIDGLSDEEREELTLILETREAGARFIAFLDKYSAGFFENEAREPANTQVTPENLPVIAKAIYNARSGYLHNGDPMYLSIPIGASSGWHMDPSVGKWEQNRSFSAKQKLPRADFFHRLVRHCLLARIEELGRGPDTSPA
jgi:hypothetical protein